MSDNLEGAQAIVGMMIERWLEENFELMDAAELPDLLVKHGLATVAPFDPETQDAGGWAMEMEAGDPWYTLTDAGKACVSVLRSPHPVIQDGEG